MDELTQATCKEKDQSDLKMAPPEESKHKFSHSEVFRLRHKLVVTLEEVNLLKDCEDRNDIKIRQLLSQVYQLEKEKDSLHHQLKQEEAKFTSAMAKVKLVREDQEIQGSKRQHDASGIATRDDKTADIFKEEARKLQLINFQQENTIKSLEAKIHSQASSAHQAMAQMSSLEDKLSTITQLYQETNAYLGRLEHLVFLQNASGKGTFHNF